MGGGLVTNNEHANLWVLRQPDFTYADLSAGFQEWRKAYWEFCDLIGEVWLGNTATYDRKEQLAFWGHWFRELADPDVRRYCVKQIQRLRGRSV